MVHRRRIKDNISPENVIRRERIIDWRKEGLTLEEIGVKLGLTKQRVQQILFAAQQKVNQDTKQGKPEIQVGKKQPKFGYQKCSTPLPGAMEAFVYMPNPMTQSLLDFLMEYLELLVEAGECDGTVGGAERTEAGT